MGLTRDDLNRHIQQRSHQLRRRVLVLLSLGPLLFTAWAALTPLPEGVLLPGQIIVEGRRQVVQASTNGTVHKILVVEGQAVKAGQLLISIEKADAVAELESLSAKHSFVAASLYRLRAEVGNSKALPTLPGPSRSPGDRPPSQEWLMENRLHIQARDIRILSAELVAARASQRAMQAFAKATRDAAELSRQQLERIRSLAEQGFMPRNRQAEMERNHLSALAESERAAQNLAQATASAAKLAAELEKVSITNDADRLTQILELEKELQNIAAAIQAAESAVRATRVVSPADGLVVGLQINTPGESLQSGQHLMDIVDDQSALVAEGRLPVDKVAEVSAGDAVDLNFVAFDRNQTPSQEARVTNISADRLIDERTGEPYFLLTAGLQKSHPDGPHEQVQLRPGMPVDIFVRTGERTILSHLLKPVLDRGKAGWHSLKEPVPAR